MSRARIICPMLLGLFLAATRGFAGERADPETWLNEAEAACGRVTNYTAILHKQQRVGGRLLPEETIRMKFRSPFSLYLKWVAPPYKGCEVLYVEGWQKTLTVEVVFPKDKAAEKTAAVATNVAAKTVEAIKTTAEAAKDAAGQAVEKTGEVLEKAGAAVEKAGADMQ